MKHDVYDDATTAANKSRRSGTDARTGSDPSHGNKEEMMRKAQEMGSPGPEHKILEHFVGNWKCDLKCWMDSNAPAHESKGTAKVSWIMGGRYIQEDFQGEAMGKPFQGRTVLGHNRVKHVFQSVWIDDMNTAMLATEGKGDSRMITLEGKGTCPATGQIDIPMKVVLRIQDKDKHLFEMYDGSKGNAKTMEITYTRQ